jgi:hypothetical protein
MIRSIQRPLRIRFASASRITDQGLLDGIKELIERAKVEKDALHPEQ